MKRNCKITVAMIVKNEEAMLGRCLESVKNADEIIIVDTGSIDKTEEIASKYTDKVFDFEWCDDFAKARNFAASKATGDWILSIDADEVLDEGGIEAIRNLLFTSKHAIGINLKCANNSYHVPRLFRNIPSVQWKGRIHEIINVTDFDRFGVGITYGSSPAHAYDPKRNMRILEKSHEEDPTNTRTMYYLGREYGYYREWEKAEAMLEKYIAASTWLKEKADAHFMLALCYWYDGKGNGEKTRLNCLQAMNINANFKAPILLMAKASFEKNAKQWMAMAEKADNSDTLFARERYDTI
jgi:glycosyltransferase involved in cell wall biosynthesis